MVAYRGRREGESLGRTPALFKRGVMERKGTDKLSSLGIAAEIEAESVRAEGLADS